MELTGGVDFGPELVRDPRPSQEVATGEGMDLGAPVDNSAGVGVVTQKGEGRDEVHDGDLVGGRGQGADAIGAKVSEAREGVTDIIGPQGAGVPGLERPRGEGD